MKLDRLKINRFRNVKPATELRFDAEWNVLLGKNGAGKTTLLKLITCVLRSDVEPLANEEFDVEYDLLFAGGARVTCKMRNEARQQPMRPEEPRRVPSPESDSFRFTAEASVEVENPPARINVIGDAEGTIVDGARSTAVGLHARASWYLCSMLLAVMRSSTVESQAAVRERIVSIALEAWELNDNLWRFDEALESYNQLVDLKSRALPGESERLAPRLDFVKEGENNSRAGTYMSSEILDAVPEARDDDDDTTLSLPHRSLPFLARAVTLFGFQSAALHLIFQEKRVTDQRTTASYGPFSLRFSRADGSIIRHEHLSYGQKRMLAFLYYLSTIKGVIVADELVNGLHYEWIVECLEKMKGRQKFLTSQNPLLLDHLSFQSADDVVANFVRCRIDGPELCWDNLTSDQARRFYDAYATGIQYVGEILRTEGLW
jgi:energy-coupling factor transporter ATP-binding protein EcfA2